MAKLGMAINLFRCIGCNTCVNACKMQNSVPMGMHVSIVKPLLA